jgi:hypothetical protein
MGKLFESLNASLKVYDNLNNHMRDIVDELHMSSMEFNS